MRSSKYAIMFLLASITFGCGKSDKVDPLSVTEEAPNVCKALAVMGTFPANGQNQQTYGIACFEGYLLQFERRSYPASSKCGEAKLQVAQGNVVATKHYEPFDSKICPTGNTIALCDMGTAKTYVYSGSEEFFIKESFEAYCKENGGTVKFR